MVSSECIFKAALNFAQIPRRHDENAIGSVLTVSINAFRTNYDFATIFAWTFYTYQINLRYTF